MKTHDLAEKTSGRVDLSISGMTCGGCASTVTRVLERVPGVVRAQVDLSRGWALVEGSAGPAELIHAVQAAGFEARLQQANERTGERNERRRGCCCG